MSTNYLLNIAKLDQIVKSTIQAIDASKSEIYDISENARREFKNLEDELNILKIDVSEIIDEVEGVEANLKESKKRLMMVNKSPHIYGQDELKKAYENADELRVRLAVIKEKEHNLIKRRNDLEIRLKESLKTVQKADNLISNLGIALGYMTGDLQQFSTQLEDMQEKQMLGIRIIKAQEEERQRVARDIHDGPAQSMSNAVLKAEICERLIDVDLMKARVELQNVKAIIRESLNDVRKIIYNLRPMSLDDLGIIPTIQRYISMFKEETDMDVNVRIKGEFDSISPVISLAVFRMIQEAFSNIKRHSKAGNVVLNIEVINSCLKIYIYDDGKGFNFEELKSRSKDINSGFGLMNMRERIELLNGAFEITSQLEMGTRINMNIPLVQEGES